MLNFSESSRTLRFFQGLPGKTEEYRQTDAALLPACAAMLCGTIVGTLLLHVIWTVPGGASPSLLLLLGLFPFQVCAFLPAVVLLVPVVQRHGFSAALDLPERPESARMLLKGNIGLLVLIYPLVSIVNIVSAKICEMVGIPVVEQMLETLGKLHPGPVFWVLAAFSAVITAPICEEVLFRLVLFRSLRRQFPHLAPYICSLLFALLHGNPQFVPGLFIVGMFLQRARACGGLPRAIIFHSMYNCVAFILLVLVITSANT